MWRGSAMVTFFSPSNEPCEPGAKCIDMFGYQLLLNYQNSMYIAVGFILLALMIHSYWPRPPPPPPPPPATPLEAVEREIEGGCGEVAWVTTGIFTLSLFLSILRPDPTPAVTLFGFYGTHVRSKGSIRSFWVFLAITFCVDVIWVVQYRRALPRAFIVLPHHAPPPPPLSRVRRSPLRPIGWEQLQLLTRKEQLAVTFSALNAIYKLMAIYACIRLYQVCSCGCGKRRPAGSALARDAALHRTRPCLPRVSAGSPSRSGRHCSTRLPRGARAATAALARAAPPRAAASRSMREVFPHRSSSPSKGRRGAGCASQSHVRSRWCPARGGRGRGGRATGRRRQQPGTHTRSSAPPPGGWDEDRI